MCRTWSSQRRDDNWESTWLRRMSTLIESKEHNTDHIIPSWLYLPASLKTLVDRVAPSEATIHKFNCYIILSCGKHFICRLYPPYYCTFHKPYRIIAGSIFPIRVYIFKSLLSIFWLQRCLSFTIYSSMFLHLMKSVTGSSIMLLFSSPPTVRCPLVNFIGPFHSLSWKKLLHPRLFGISFIFLDILPCDGFWYNASSPPSRRTRKFVITVFFL